MSHSNSGETGTASIEISVPTDLTVTSEADSDVPRENKRSALYTDKAQFQLANEKLKLELQEKSSELMVAKAECSALLHQKNLENERKLSEKQASINRLEARLFATTDELKLLKERAAKELAHLLEKCCEFQQNQARLAVKQEEVRSSLENLTLSDELYNRLRIQSRDDLTLSQYVSLRVYEMVMPLKVKIKELEITKSSLESSIAIYEKELQKRSKENDELIKETNELREKLVEYSLRSEEMRKEMKIDDFRVHNFDRIKRERDQYEEEKEKLYKEKSSFELTSTVLKNEKRHLEERLAHLQTESKNLQLELSQYKNDYVDAKKQLSKIKDEAVKSDSLVKIERDRNEDIHERFINSKSDILSLTEKLQASETSLNLLKDKCLHLEKSDNETRMNLKEKEVQLSELTKEHESLQWRFTKDKDNLKLENSEIQANYKSLVKTYNEILASNSKLMKDLQNTQSELQDIKINKDDIVCKLKQQIHDLQSKLSRYNEIEDEYLASIKLSASIADGNASHQVPVSSIVKGKLSEEVISLNKRILHLEREKVEALSIIESFISTLDQMRTSLASYKTALAFAGRPSSDLLQKIRTQEEQVVILEEALNACTEAKSSSELMIQRLKRDVKFLTSSLGDMRISSTEIEHLKNEIVSLRNLASQFQNRNKSSKINVPPSIPSAIKITKGET